MTPRPASMIKILVSACLLGEKVRFDGRDAAARDAVLERWHDEGRIVPFCPEVAGGLGVPRPAAEIRGGDGRAVLMNAAMVVTRNDDDVTAAFLRGAQAALDAARREHAAIAILKDGSPSCGSAVVYDGTFTGRRRAGPGVTTALLERHGIRVFGEKQIPEAASYLEALERERGL